MRTKPFKSVIDVAVLFFTDVDLSETNVFFFLECTTFLNTKPDGTEVVNFFYKSKEKHPRTASSHRVARREEQLVEKLLGQLKYEVVKKKNFIKRATVGVRQLLLDGVSLLRVRCIPVIYGIFSKLCLIQQ